MGISVGKKDMKGCPTIYLICQGKKNQTIAIFENFTMQIFDQPLYDFVEALCNSGGTCIEFSRKMALKQFNYVKKSPLYIGSLNHLIVVPSCSLESEDCFLYNVNVVYAFYNTCNMTLMQFLDGSQYKMKVQYRSIRSQFRRAQIMSDYYRKSHLFLT